MEPFLKSDDKRSEVKLNIMLVDDHPLVREALKNLIETQKNMKVIAEASNGKEAVDLAIKLRPNVIVMDIGMPEMNGLEATRQIKTQCPNIAVLVLTVHTDSEHVLGILKAGAAGYLTKTAAGNDIIRALKSIIAGESILTTSILQQIINAVPIEQQSLVLPSSSIKLTDKEILILKLAAKGLSNKNIASTLNVGETTIKTYLGDIFSKMEVGSRTEAVIKGLKTGLISLNDLN
jgi:two-component system, NarL family, response regulator LiaR